MSLCAVWTLSVRAGTAAVSPPSVCRISPTPPGRPALPPYLLTASLLSAACHGVNVSVAEYSDVLINANENLPTVTITKTEVINLKFTFSLQLTDQQW